MSRPEMLLSDFLHQSYFPSFEKRRQRLISPAYQRECLSLLWRLAEDLGEPPRLRHFTDENLGYWQSQWTETDLADATVKRIRETILAIWRYAAGLGYICPGRSTENTQGRGTVEYNRRTRKRDKLTESLIDREGVPTLTSRNLWEVCEAYYFPLRIRLRSQHTRHQYQLAIRQLEKMLGREATLDDLNDDCLTMMLRWLEPNVAAVTANERVGRLKTLWTWLAKRGHLPKFPTVERLITPDRTPRSWTRAELTTLFEAADSQTGRIGGIQAGLWWTALLRWLWNTAERRGATFAMTWKMIDLDTGVAILPPAIRKGQKKVGLYQLWPETIAALRAIEKPERKLVFPWPWCEVTFYTRFTAMLKAAGLPSGRTSKTHSMRVAHASWRMNAGDDATTALGHSDPGTTQRHYIDPRVSGANAKPLFDPLAVKIGGVV